MIIMKGIKIGYGMAWNNAMASMSTIMHGHPARYKTYHAERSEA